MNKFYFKVKVRKMHLGVA